MKHLRKIMMLAVLATFCSSAMGKESVKIVLIGPTIGNETVFAAQDIEAWTQMLESSEVVDDPALPFDRMADSYTVDHHVGHGKTTVAVNEFRYVPSTDESPGFVYFVNVRGGWSSSVGMWFKLRERADREVKDLLGLVETTR